MAHRKSKKKGWESLPPITFDEDVLDVLRVGDPLSVSDAVRRAGYRKNIHVDKLTFAQWNGKPPKQFAEVLGESVVHASRMMYAKHNPVRSSGVYDAEFYDDEGWPGGASSYPAEGRYDKHNGRVFEKAWAAAEDDYVKYGSFLHGDYHVDVRDVGGGFVAEIKGLADWDCDDIQGDVMVKYRALSPVFTTMDDDRPVLHQRDGGYVMLWDYPVFDLCPYPVECSVEMYDDGSMSYQFKPVINRDQYVGVHRWDDDLGDVVEFVVNVVSADGVFVPIPAVIDMHENVYVPKDILHPECEFDESEECPVLDNYERVDHGVSSDVLGVWRIIDHGVKLLRDGHYLIIDKGQGEPHGDDVDGFYRGVFPTPVAFCDVMAQSTMGVGTGDPYTMNTRDSVVYDMVRRIHPDATEAVITVVVHDFEGFTGDGMVVSSTAMYINDDEGVITFEYAALAYLLENTPDDIFTMGVSIRVFDPVNTHRIVRPDGMVLDAPRKIATTVLFDGGVYCGMPGGVVFDTYMRDARTGEINAPEDGVDYVGLDGMEVSPGYPFGGAV